MSISQAFFQKNVLINTLEDWQRDPNTKSISALAKGILEHPKNGQQANHLQSPEFGSRFMPPDAPSNIISSRSNSESYAATNANAYGLS